MAVALERVKNSKVFTSSSRVSELNGRITQLNIRTLISAATHWALKEGADAASMQQAAEAVASRDPERLKPLLAQLDHSKEREVSRPGSLSVERQVHREGRRSSGSAGARQPCRSPHQGVVGLCPLAQSTPTGADCGMDCRFDSADTVGTMTPPKVLEPALVRVLDAEPIAEAGLPVELADVEAQQTLSSGPVNSSSSMPSARSIAPPVAWSAVAGASAPGQRPAW